MGQVLQITKFDFLNSSQIQLLISPSLWLFPLRCSAKRAPQSGQTLTPDPHWSRHLCPPGEHPPHGPQTHRWPPLCHTGHLPLHTGYQGPDLTLCRHPKAQLPMSGKKLVRSAKQWFLMSSVHYPTKKLERTYLYHIIWVPCVGNILLVSNNLLCTNPNILLKHNDGILPNLPKVSDDHLKTKDCIVDLSIEVVAF